jgi:glycolate oxidase FAD binding subunit
VSRVADALAGVAAGEALREGGLAVAGARPDATVTPTSVEGVADVLKVASARGFGVVPVGGGTDLGPMPPSKPFVILSTRGLSGVEAYEPADLTMSAWAGTTLRELGDVTAPHAQWLPFDPPSMAARTLGGLAATGVRSPLCASYGAPRDHILGLTLVTGDGRVLRLGGRVMKNVAGFDLVKLLVGSRGRLGVVVSVTARLFPRPEREIALILDAARAEDLVAAARAVATAPVLPASAVVAAGGAVRGASLVVRVGGASETVSADAARLQAHVGRSLRVVEGAEASSLFADLRDHGAVGDVVVRMAALPASVGDLLAAVASVPGPTRVLADAIAGRVRIATQDLSADALAKLRGAAGRVGGSCVLERGPVELLQVPEASPADPRVKALASALEGRFDPGGVLWPGRSP